jgi:hypothetical protein
MTDFHLETLKNAARANNKRVFEWVQLNSLCRASKRVQAEKFVEKRKKLVAPCAVDMFTIASRAAKDRGNKGAYFGLRRNKQCIRSL